MTEQKSTHELGVEGENAAAAYLTQRGYTILERNYRAKEGEIDLIALDGEVLVFVEVKMRTATPAQSKYGRPLRAVNAAKKERLRNAAKRYIADHSLIGKPARIDVMEIYRSVRFGIPEYSIHYIAHAVGGSRT